MKIWGEARVVEDDPALTKALMPKGYRARPEQVIVFKIAAWDTNCPQHIPQKFDAADVAAAMAEANGRIEQRDARIKELEKQMKQAAKDLEFEKAASLRDQVIELRRTLALEEVEVS